MVPFVEVDICFFVHTESIRAVNKPVHGVIPGKKRCHRRHSDDGAGCFMCGCVNNDINIGGARDFILFHS